MPLEFVDEPGLEFVEPSSLIEKAQGAIKHVAGLPAKGYEEIAGLNIPGVSPAAGLISKALPTTLSGWLALGLPLPIKGLGIGPTFARAGRAITGGLVGGTLEEGPTVETAKKGAYAGAGQILGEAVGAPIGKLIGLGSRMIRSAMGQSQFQTKVVNAIRNYIPGLPEKPTGSQLVELIEGGAGQTNLGDAYNSGIKTILKDVGQDAKIANAKIYAILTDYFPEEFAIKRGAIGVTGDVAEAIGKQTELPVSDIMQYARKIGERVRTTAVKRGVTRAEIAADNRAIRDELAGELNKLKSGAGDAYKQVNTEYWKGKTVLDALQTHRILRGTPTKETTIDFNEAQEMLRENLADLYNVGAKDLVSAILRGRPLGSLPSTTRLPGHVAARGGRLALYEHTPTILSPNLPPVLREPISPRISGYEGQRLSDLLREEQQ